MTPSSCTRAQSTISLTSSLELKLPLSLAKTYFKRNCLMVNSSKTQCLFIGIRYIIRPIPNSTTINFDKASITPSKHVRNLGIYKDRHMTFDVHLHGTHVKVMAILLYLNRIKDKFEPETWKIGVESRAISSINYCLPVYGKTNATLLQKMQRLQNFAAKVCAGGARGFDYITPFITQLSWPKTAKKSNA